MRFEILKAGNINTAVSWNVKPFILVDKYRPFGEASTETSLLRNKTVTWQDSVVK